LNPVGRVVRPILLAVAAVATVAASGCSRDAVEKADLSVLPAPGAVPGCRQADAPQGFPGQDLYKLVDGGAVRFLEKGFRWAAASGYECAGGRVAIEVYRMTAPEGAKAVYVERAGVSESAQVGDASQVSRGFLEFIRGPFYVTVTAFSPGADSQAAILTLAHEVDAHLKNR
jgi:hypothetical protein